MKIGIKTWIENDEPRIYVSFDINKNEEPTLAEVSLALYELEKIKQQLLDMEFESDLEVRK